MQNEYTEEDLMDEFLNERLDMLEYPEDTIKYYVECYDKYSHVDLKNFY